MKTYRYCLYCLSFFAIIYSCNQKANSIEDIEISHRPMDFDTVINEITSFNNYLFCVQADGCISVFDSNFSHIEQIERKFDSIYSNYIYALHDSLFFGNWHESYALNKNWKIITYPRIGLRYTDILLEDSTYLIYGSCAGEWGGSIFFRNKNSGQVYSYPVTCASQVLKYKEMYVVASNLAHLSNFMSYLFISDPKSLYPIADTLAYFSNWYLASKDSDDVSNHKIKIPGFYERNSMSIVTFPFDNDLFAIVVNDSSTAIASIKMDSMAIKRIIYNQPLRFHISKTVEFNKSLICLYRLTSGSAHAAYSVMGNYSGLIKITKDKIDFIDESDWWPDEVEKLQ